MSGMKKIYAPNLVVLCVDVFSGGDFSGSIKHLYSEEALPVSGASDLLVQLDALYDEWNYPQRSTAQRFFGKGTKDAVRREAVHLKDREKVREIDSLYGERGGIATFLLQVEYRQNATWQGNAFWLERGLSQRFQSALELIKMMDAALLKSTGAGV